MEPYTAAGISQRENAEDDHTTTLQPMLYELVGVVVHSGQASAGHYYSFRKSKRYMVKPYLAATATSEISRRIFR